MIFFSGQNKSTGELSFITCLMNFAGSMGKLSMSVELNSFFWHIYWGGNSNIFIFSFCSESIHQHPGKSTNKRYPLFVCFLEIPFYDYVQYMHAK